jgi:hypothetical protein
MQNLMQKPLLDFAIHCRQNKTWSQSCENSAYSQRGAMWQIDTVGLRKYALGVPYDLLCKACTCRGLVYSANGRIFSNMLCGQYVHLTNGKAYSSACQRGCHIRTDRNGSVGKNLVVNLKGLDTKTNLLAINCQS